MLSHVPLFCHPNPKNVLIIGGGDGGILREVLKHPVDKAYMVEIDKGVIDASKRFLKSICRDAFDNERTKVLIDDGARFIKETKTKFDAVIIDSSDPKGPAGVLFTTEFYKDIRKIMTKNAVATRQVGSSYFQPDELAYSYERAKSVFKYAAPYVISVPTYIGGHFDLLFISDAIDPHKVSLKRIRERYNLLKLDARYYNPDVHAASFAVPNYIRRQMKTQLTKRT